MDLLSIPYYTICHTLNSILVHVRHFCLQQQRQEEQGKYMNVAHSLNVWGDVATQRLHPFSGRPGQSYEPFQPVELIKVSSCHCHIPQQWRSPHMEGMEKQWGTNRIMYFHRYLCSLWSTEQVINWEELWPEHAMSCLPAENTQFFEVLCQLPHCRAAPRTKNWGITSST